MTLQLTRRLGPKSAGSFGRLGCGAWVQPRAARNCRRWVNRGSIVAPIHTFSFGLAFRAANSTSAVGVAPKRYPLLDKRQCSPCAPMRTADTKKPQSSAFLAGTMEGYVKGWWCPGMESNHRHEHFQCSALPPELPGRTRWRTRRARKRPYRRPAKACPGSVCAEKPLSRNSSVVGIVGLGFHHRNRIVALQPAAKIDIPATAGTEGPGGMARGLAAGRAASDHG